MRRIVRLLPGRKVASRIPAVGGGDIQAVVIVDVAGSASGHFAAVGHQRMRVRQREAESVVIELAVGPLCYGVASGASRGGRRKARGDVVGNRAAKRRRAVPSRLVAAHAVGRVQRVIIVDVAGGAGCGGRRGVRACQRKTGGAVIERSGIPALGGMAGGAIGHGKSRTRGRVHRGSCLLPLRQMAA